MSSDRENPGHEAESLTNDVVIKPGEYVEKEISSVPGTAFLAGLAKTAGGNPRLPSRAERLTNEVEMPYEVEDHGFNTAKILNLDGFTIRTDYLSGEPLEEKINKGQEQEVRRVGERFGEIFRDMHENDTALLDARKSNYKVERTNNDFQINVFDFEYATRQASENDKEIDLITLTSSIRQTENPEIFLEGFESEYGKIDDRVKYQANLTSTPHAAMEFKPNWLKNSITNRKTDLDYSFSELVKDRATEIYDSVRK